MSCIDILQNTEPGKVAYIDVETTGLTSEDEILELAIVDGMGRIVYLQRFNPLRRKEWPEAAEVNGICPEDVEGLPHIAGCVHYISRIFWRFEAIIGFNVGFDLGFLERAGVDYSHVKQIGDLQADLIEEMHNRPSLVRHARSSDSTTPAPTPPRPTPSQRESAPICGGSTRCTPARLGLSGPTSCRTHSTSWGDSSENKDRVQRQAHPRNGRNDQGG